MTQKHLGEKCGGLFFAELMSFSFAPVQVMYFSSLFPYVVLFCFLVRGLMLKGSVDGIAHMFTPKVRMEESLFLTSVFSTMHANKSLSSHLSWRRCWSRRCGGRPPPRSSLPSVWVLEESLPSPVTIRLTTTATLMPCSSLSSTFWPPFWPHWLCLLCWASRQTSWMKSVLWSKLNTVFWGGGFGNIECNPPKKKQKSDSKVHEYCILTKNHTSKLQSPQSLCYKQWQLSLFSVTYMLLQWWILIFSDTVVSARASSAFEPKGPSSDCSEFLVSDGVFLFVTLSDVKDGESPRLKRRWFFSKF